MNDLQWTLNLNLNEVKRRIDFPHEVLIDANTQPITFDAWEQAGRPSCIEISGSISKINLWLKEFIQNHNVVKVDSLRINQESVSGNSYFSEKQINARREILKQSNDSPPLVLLSKLFDTDVGISAVTSGSTLRCRYMDGVWGISFESADYPNVVDFLKKKIDSKYLLAKKEEGEFDIDLKCWIEPGLILSGMKSSRYYECFRLTSLENKSYGTPENTECHRITYHPDYIECVAPNDKQIDATLATLVTGSLLLLPAISLWLNRFKQSVCVPSDVPMMRHLIEYLCQPEFIIDAAIRILCKLGLPEDSLEVKNELLVLNDDWYPDQQWAFQLIIPHCRIESVFKLDRSRLDSRAVLA